MEEEEECSTAFSTSSAGGSSTSSSSSSDEDDDASGAVAPAPPPRNGQKRETPFMLVRQNKAINKNKRPPRYADELILRAFSGYNKLLGEREYCVNRACSNPRLLSCACCSVLRDHEEEEEEDDHHDLIMQQDRRMYRVAVAEYQMYFSALSKTEQQSRVVEWMRMSSLLQEGGVYCRAAGGAKGHKYYAIPFITPPDCNQEDYDDLRQASICRSSLMDILGVGKEWWATCQRHADNNTIPDYRTKGKPSNFKRKWDDIFAESLVDHFEELRKETAPIATRYVREVTGEVTTRDDDDKNEYLSPNWSKRRCYAKYCLSRGVHVRANNKGTIIKSPLPGWEGGEPLPTPPSWPGYLYFWKRHYSFLKVSRPAEDICPQCCIFHNQHKCKQCIVPGVANPYDDLAPPPPPPLESGDDGGGGGGPRQTRHNEEEEDQNEEGEPAGEEHGRRIVASLATDVSSCTAEDVDEETLENEEKVKKHPQSGSPCANG